MTRVRDEWLASSMPAVTVPAVVGASMAAEARQRFEGAGFAPYRLLDRGRYDVLEHPDFAEMLDVLTGIAGEVTGRTLALQEARVLRLGAGDYILVRHDRVYEERPVQLILDLSAAAVAGAEVHFRHRGQVFFVVPSAPGALSIVERGPTVMSNHTYLTKRRPDASVVRLVALLAASST